MNPFMIFLMMKYSHLIYSLSIDGNCCDSDNTDDDDSDDDEICYIRDHREENNDTMELLIVWISGKREWSNIKNVKKDFPNIVSKYINDKGIKLDSSKRKRISISEILRESEHGKNEQMWWIIMLFINCLSHKINLNHSTMSI